MKKLMLLSVLMSPFLAFSQDDLTCYKAGLHNHSVGKHMETARLADPRLNDYDVGFYFLDIAADNQSTYVEGTVKITATIAADNINEFVLELADELTISEITINESSTTFSHSGNLIIIDLPSAATTGEILEVAVSYGGTPPDDGGFFSGISQGTASFDIPVTWTLSEPFNASDWFPVKQVLTDKADSANIYITVPSDLKAAASGILTNISEVDDTHLRFEWETRYPIAYYLLSMTIAPYEVIEQQVYLPGIPRPMPISNFIYADSRVIDQVTPTLDYTPELLVLFSQLFGAYPFSDEKYGHAMAPMGGGMEHQTVSTMQGFNLNLIAHELLHQWFGDNVTCKTWQDIWINEGFARYGEYIALENLLSQEEADAWMNNNYDQILSVPDGSVFVPEESAEDVGRIFDFRLTYNKGGALLHMLRLETGNDELFFDALRVFHTNFAEENASGEDFANFMQSYTQIPMTDFFEQWYYGEGYPIYDMTWDYNDGTLTVFLDQTTSAPDITPFFSTVLPVEIETASGKVEYRIKPDIPQDQFTFSIAEDVLNVKLDPRNIILKKTGTVTSVEPENNYGFVCYPNPASQSLHIKITSGLTYQVSLTDIQGRVLIVREMGPGSSSQISTSDVPAGMYLLRLQNSQGKWVRKIQITH